MKPTQLLTLAILLTLLPLANAATFDILSLSYNPAPAAPGQLLTLYITAQNTSNNNSEPITITLKPTYPFSLSTSGKSEVRLSTVLANQTALGIIEVQVDKEALNGIYTIEAQVKDHQNGVIIGKEFSIQVLALKPQIEIVGINHNTAEPGQTLPAIITIQNVGSSTAKNIFIGISDDRTVTTTGVVVDRPIKALGESLKFIPELDPNQTYQLAVDFGIDSTAEQKTHQVPITIKFQDTNRSEYSVTRSIGIRVQGHAQVDASITPNNKKPLSPATVGEININLFNRGTASAKNIVVTIHDAPIWNIQTEKTIFIGTLDPDDFDSFAVTAFIKPDAQTTSHNIDITIDYKNEDNQTQTVNQTIQVEVLTAEQARIASGQPDNTISNIITLLIVLGILYWGYNRFIKKNGAPKK